MSSKRSDRLRSMISATVAEAAAEAAPVTFIGASMASAQSINQPIQPSEKIHYHYKEEVRKTEPLPKQEEDKVPSLPPIVEEEQAPLQHPAQALKPVPPPVVISTATNLESAQDPLSRSRQFAPQIQKRERSWDKISITLQEPDFYILENSDLVARSMGVQIRKGGKPSMFVRAGLRLLEHLRQTDPEAWRARILATMSPENAA